MPDQVDRHVHRGRAAQPNRPFADSQLDLTSDSFLAAIVESSDNAVFAKRLDGTILTWNAAAERLYGYSASEAIGRNVAFLVPEQGQAELSEILARVAGGEALHSHMTERIRKDGTRIPVSLSISPVRDDQGVIVAAATIARDLSEQQRSIAALQALNRELRLLSDCNQVLIRAKDEKALLAEICRLLCEDGGYRFAWVGYVEHDAAKTVRPVAWAGYENGYLASVDVTWANSARGRGPVGTAIRSGKTVYTRDISIDPHTAPWHESAAQRGYRSTIALPLKNEDDGVYGTLTVYASEPMGFSTSEVHVLEELAGDLAFGIRTLRVETERKLNLARYRSLFEDSPVPMWEEDDSAIKEYLERLAASGINDVIAYVLANPEEYARCIQLTRNLNVNKAAVRLFEAESREELLARNSDLYRDESDRGIYRFWAAMLAGERSATFEETDISLHGREINILETCTVVPGHEETYDLVYIADIDISARKRAEEKIVESERLYRAMFEENRAIKLLIDPTTSAIIDANSAASDFYGYPHDRLCALKMTDLSALPATEVLANTSRIAHNELATLTVRHRLASGALKDVEINTGPIEAQGRRLLFTIVQDVSEREKAREPANHRAQRLRLALEQTVRAMSQMVEARDPYTAWHERRTADLAVAIGTEMGMAGEQLKGLQLAALIHDVGKIVVPAEILSKPGRLSAIEFNLIKQHAQAGHDILAGIEFERPVAEFVVQHHERLDGTGYPYGLTQAEILPEARILAVADVVEAMSSHRPYRPALGVASALAEIHNNAVLKYDADVVAACERAFAAGFVFSD